MRELDYGDWDKQNGMELEWITNIERLVKGTIIIFCGYDQFSLIYKYLKEKDFLCRPIIWLKPNPTVINCEHLYINSTEIAVYGKRRNAIYNPKYKRNVFEYPSPSVDRLHPTEKPIKMFYEFIRDTTNENDLILDPFLGSGTTILAAERLNRRWIGIEIEPSYVKTAGERIKQEQDQIKLNI